MKNVLLAVLLVFVCSTGFAQSVQPEFGAGIGSFFAEEGQTFDAEALFGAVHWYAVSIPIGNETSSGVGLELGFNGDPEAESAVAYSLWSLNRTNVLGLMYGGSDMKIGESVGGRYRYDFDLRLVVGTFLAKVGPGDLAVEVYSLEENRPISFAIIYRF